MQEEILPEQEEIAEDLEDDEEHGNFNEFGAPDPLGVPIDEVFAEPAAIIPAVALTKELKLKPEKWRFKAFCLNDGTTGYLWNFYLYRGATEVRDDGWSATAFPIKKLTDPFTNLHHTGKIL